MKCKRLMSILLSMIMALGLLAGCGGSDTALAQSYDEELTKAIDAGLMHEKWLKDLSKPVTIGEFNKSLTKLVAMCNTDFVPKWEKTAAHALKRTDIAQRDDAILSIFEAAIVMGIDAARENHMIEDWESKSPAEDWWEGRSWDYDYFPNWETIYDDGDNEDYDILTHSAWYVERHLSLVSQKHIFEPTEKWTFGFDQNVSGEEAARALVRFMESSPDILYGKSGGEVKDRVIGAEDQALLDAAESKKSTILNSETAIEPSGKTYYISNSGSDRNNGRSPQTAWATLDKLQREMGRFEPGTTVLFERGGLWRGQITIDKEDLILSAYGEGEKPRIYASPESGVGAKKWSLWYDKDGVKIWKYHRKLQDVGGIVMNDGDSYASRVYSYWDGQKAVFWEDLNRVFDIPTALEHDLQFYCGYPDNVASMQIPFYAFDVDMNGDVYLRCDKGNPGELYDSIEFQCTDVVEGFAAVIRVCASNVTVDNLCLMYHHSMGISLDSAENVTVQNCHVAFVGGGSHVIGMYDGMIGSGEGIRIDGYGNKAVNNYVHDCFDGGIIFEPDLQISLDTDTPIPEELLAKKWGNILIEGNVVEKCRNGVLVGVHCEDAVMPEIGGITIKDNDILYSGYGWSGDEHYKCCWGFEYPENAITFWDDDYPHGTYLVENNRMYVSKGALVHTYLTGNNLPIFKGNTYVQNLNGEVVHYCGQAPTAQSKEQIERICNGILKDKEAVVW